MSEFTHPDAPSPALLLTGRVIDGSGAAPIEDGAVLVQGDQIVQIGPRASVQAPEGARGIAADTILPGLIDLHVHARPGYLPWFTAMGVTTVRDACCSFDILSMFGEVRGPKPRVMYSGPLLDGPNSFFKHFDPEQMHAPEELNASGASIVVRTPDEARWAVDLLAMRGVHHIKLYEQIPLDAFRAAAQRARDHGLPVMTDLGMQCTRGLAGAEVDALQAIQAGVDSIEHLSGYALAYQRLGGDLAALNLDPAILDHLARASVDAGVTVVPTFMVHLHDAEDTPPDPASVVLGRVDDPEAASLLRQWERVHAAYAGDRGPSRRDLRLSRALVRRIAELGGRIGAGTDTPAGAYNAPGLALHTELEQLVLAGLSPLQAIQAATSEAGRLLRRPDLGTLAPGQVADLLLVHGDPTQDIRATRDIAQVIQAGQLHDPADLLNHARAEGRRWAELLGA